MIVTNLEKEYIKNIAILLTCYNRINQTLRCLESLLQVSVPQNHRIEVFLVDDNSPDATGKIVKDTYPQVNVIYGDGELYWNRGMILAWKTAAQKLDYDFYLWLNDDVILVKETLNIFLDDLQKSGKEAAIIAGACKSSTNKVSYSGYLKKNGKKKLIPTGAPQQCDYFNGNVVLIPSSIFKKVGFLDPLFHHAQGDFDYGLRAKKEGFISYISSKYVGICELNKELPVWCNPNYSFITRWKHFKSPLGGRPKLNFAFNKRHNGLASAIFHYCTIHIRSILPILWKK
ncbi:glycosyltransferase [Draconibacterium orientale]|uniref:glycosyltransferase family 2 protein n=1 Tax=Draconibacterium orientale TaxID=1168034 RepID=UPI002A0A3987|nr:glycosyltransferase [Draconibacterium orientale]